MSELHLPISLDMKAVWPEEDLYGRTALPDFAFGPTYKANIDLLVGEKVHSYQFKTIHGEIVVRDATLGEWKLGQKMKEAVYG